MEKLRFCENFSLEKKLGNFLENEILTYEIREDSGKRKENSLF